jgi:hypothetical protein
LWLEISRTLTQAENEFSGKIEKSHVRRNDRRNKLEISEKLWTSKKPISITAQKPAAEK